MGSNNITLKSKIRRNSAFCVVSNNTTLKSEIRSNSAFRISPHMLCYIMRIKSATLKLEIGNYEIRSFDFHKERPRVLLHVLYCYMGSNNAILKFEIGIYAFRILLHVIYWRMGRNSATLKSEIERNSTFCMWSNSTTLKLEIGKNAIIRVDKRSSKPPKKKNAIIRAGKWKWLQCYGWEKVVIRAPRVLREKEIVKHQVHNIEHGREMTTLPWKWMGKWCVPALSFYKKRLWTSTLPTRFWVSYEETKINSFKLWFLSFCSVNGWSPIFRFE